VTNTYFIENNPNDIAFVAAVSTQGLGFSEADKEIPGGSTQFVADSTGDATGSISKTVIATANQLDGCIVEIDTIIELDTVDPSLWQSCFDNLNAAYQFTGGKFGDVQFVCDSDDKKKSGTGKTITIAKMIKLILK
jgi:hypothetical protein